MDRRMGHTQNNTEYGRELHLRHRQIDRAEVSRRIAREKTQRRTAQLWLAFQTRTVTRLQAAFRGARDRRVLARGSTPQAEAEERARAEAQLQAECDAAARASRQAAHEARLALLAAEQRQRAERSAVVVVLQLDASERVIEDAAVQVRQMSHVYFGGALAADEGEAAPSVIVLSLLPAA